jgi:hypothetical protein
MRNHLSEARKAIVVTVAVVVAGRVVAGGSSEKPRLPQGRKILQ